MNNIAERIDKIPFSGIRKVFEEVDHLESKGKDIINLGIGRPNFDTPDHIKAAAIQGLNDGEVHYTSNYGIPSLVSAIQTKLKQDNEVDVNKDEIIVTVGANEAVFLAFMAVLNPGDEVLIPNPSWSHYFYCAELAEAKSVSYPILKENDFNIDIADIESRITSKTKMIVINTPHNPTGAMCDKETLQEIADLAKKHDLIVLSDEIYEKLIYGDSVHTSIASLPDMGERTFIVNGFSKAYSMTGWRVGYIAGPKAYIDAMVRVHQYTVTCATSFAQLGATAALTESQQCVEDMRAEFDQRRQLVVESINKMDQLKVIEPKGAFYAFVDISQLELTDTEAAHYYLHEAGVAMVPGSVFGEYGTGYLRVAFSNSYDNIKKAMERISDATQLLNR